MFVPGITAEKGDVKALVRALIDEARSTVRCTCIQQRLSDLCHINDVPSMLTFSSMGAMFAAGQHDVLRACQRGHRTEGRQQLRHL